MKFRKIFAITLIFVLFVSSISAQKAVVITGKIKNNTFDKVDLTRSYSMPDAAGNSTPPAVIATSPIDKDGRFVLNFSLEKPDLFRLNFENNKYFLCALYPGEKITLEIDAADLSTIDFVSGSKSLTFIKQFLPLKQEIGELYNTVNQALQSNEEQLFYNQFYKDFLPFTKINREIDTSLLRLFETVSSLDHLVKKYTKNQKVTSDKVDSLLLIAPGILKTATNAYLPFDNYMKNIKDHYNFTDNRVSGQEVFYAKIDQYLALLDLKYALAERCFSSFIQEAKTWMEERDRLTYEGALDQKKTKIALANDLVTLSSNHTNSINALKSDFTSSFQSSESMARDINQVIGKKISDVVASFQKQFDTENQRINTLIRELFINNKEDLAVLMVMDHFPIEQNFDLHKEILTALHQKYPDNDVVKNNYKTITSPTYTTAIGSVAPDLAFPDPSGKILKLSDLRGKYVLLDFWASWCGPCRRENPHVVNLYNKYNSKGFEVFSVSLDRSKDSWTRAITADNLSWPYHVSDLKHWSSDASKLYGVNSIPSTFLLDKEGRIIAKNLRGEALTNALKNIFGE